MSNALWMPHGKPHAGDNGTGKSNKVIIKITNSALAERGLPPGSFIEGMITDQINPYRQMACIIGKVAIIGRIKLIDSEAFKIGNRTIRYDEVDFFVAITRIRQQVANY